MHTLQSSFYLTTALHVSGIIITHLQEHKTTVTTASGNRYTVIDRVKFLLLKSTYQIKITIVFDDVYSAEYILQNILHFPQKMGDNDT